MGASVLVIAELSEDKLHRLSLEVITAARQMGESKLILVLLGDNIGRLTNALHHLPVDEILLLDHSLLKQYTPDAYTSALADVVQEIKPDFVVFPHSYQVRDYAPRLASRFQRSLVSECVAIDETEDCPVFMRPVFQGRAYARIALPGLGPHFISIQSGAFNMAESNTLPNPVVRTIQPELFEQHIRTRPEGIISKIRQAAALDKAKVIVAVGRGIKSPGQVAQAGRLAELLGAELAASRPVCDEGWVPMERQIGSSGWTVTPKVYLALGISGAIQHVIGMKGAGTIIAINKDVNAPIFSVSDIGVVADLAELLPLLIAELENAGK